MNPAPRLLATGILAGFAFLSVQLAPLPSISTGKAYAAGKNDKGDNGNRGKSDERGAGQASASTDESTGDVGPEAAIRQYVSANGLKQGDVAKLLKSWNSLNRNEQAYLNNADNPKSLPGKQVAYIRGNIAAAAALEEFNALGGVAPTEEEAQAAQHTVDLYGAWTEYQTALPERQAELLAEFPELGDPASLPTGAEAADAQMVLDQHAAWTNYQDATAAADDAFLAASVSYGAGTDEALLADLRTTVDAIIAEKGLDALVTELDAAPIVDPAVPLQ
jgi:hypothetical protein